MLYSYFLKISFPIQTGEGSDRSCAVTNDNILMYLVCFDMTSPFLAKYQISGDL